MRKLFVLCLGMLLAIPFCISQKINKNYCTAVTYFIAPQTPNGFDMIHFFTKTHLKKIQSYAIEGYESKLGVPDLVDQALDDVDVAVCEKTFYLFCSVDSISQYDGNESFVREVALNQTLIDLSTPIGKLNARNTLFALTKLLEGQRPTKHGTLRTDLKTNYCLGWFKLWDGSVVMLSLRCVTDSNSYFWEVSLQPSTGTLDLRNTLFLGKQ